MDAKKEQEKQNRSADPFDEKNNEEIFAAFENIEIDDPLETLEQLDRDRFFLEHPTRKKEKTDVPPENKGAK